MQVSELLMGSVLVALGATVGTPARFFVSGVIARRFGETFPWGTLVVNVSGCLIMGAVAAFAKAHGLSSASAAWFLAPPAFLASYTPVSSFALPTPALCREGEPLPATGYVLVSLLP